MGKIIRDGNIITPTTYIAPKAEPEYVSFGNYSGTTLDLSWLRTDKITNMNGMFAYCSALTSVNLSSFNTNNVTSMSYMFSDCSKLTGITFPQNFGLPTAEDATNNMYSMFYHCTSLISLDLSNFNTSKVKNMVSMFEGCSSLISLDLSSFNTGKVTDMRAMFYKCSSLTSLNLSSFDTSSCIYMGSYSSYDNSSSGMFSGCSSLTSLDLSKFNTSKVTDMSYMFAYCSILTSLDLSSFDFTNVTVYSNMFEGVPDSCEILVKDETAKTWITSKFSNLTNVKVKGGN